MPSTKRIVITAENGHFIVPVNLTIKDKLGREISERYEFLLDTGATKCVVPTATANAHMIEPILDSSGAAATEVVTTANGLVPLSLIRAEAMSVSGTELSVKGPIDIWLGNDFLLGMNFLSDFRLRIEYGQKLIIEE